VAIVHAGRIVTLDTPRRLLDTLGEEVVELRVESGADDVLTHLRARGGAGTDAFALGATVTVPLRDTAAGPVLDAVAASGARITATTTRRPTLDDVYLRLTGDRLAA
jgi:ABC-2 type transport system ATP-binding protein